MKVYVCCTLREGKSCPSDGEIFFAVRKGERVNLNPIYIRRLLEFNNSRTDATYFAASRYGAALLEAAGFEYHKLYGAEV